MTTRNRWTRLGVAVALVLAGALGTVALDRLPRAGADDDPDISIGNAAVDEGVPPGTASVSLQLSVAAAIPISVDYATIPGSATEADYAPTAGTATFPAGVTEVFVEIPIVDDDIYEFYESFTVQISNPIDGATIGGETAGTATGTVSIGSDDSAPTIGIASTSIAEAMGTVAVPITLSNPSFQAESVDFVTVADGAADDTDFVAAAGTLDIPAMATEVELVLTILDDGIEEPDEDFGVQLSFASTEFLDPDHARVTIVDDDFFEGGGGEDDGGEDDDDPPEPSDPPPPVLPIGTPTAPPVPAVAAPPVPVVPVVQAPPATDPPTTTTTSTTTTSTTTTTTTTAPTTTTTAPERSTPDIGLSTTTSPPGGSLDVTGTDVPAGCGRVFVHIGDAPVGSATPTGGSFRLGDVHIPGDAADGASMVSLSCDRYGDAPFATTFLTVSRDGVHRSGLATMVPRWRDVSLHPGSLASAGAVALGAVLVFGFPAELFDATFKANEHRIHARLARLRRRRIRSLGGSFASRLVGVIAFVGMGAALGTLLSPNVGWDRSTLALGLGIALGVSASNLVLRVPDNLWSKRITGSYGRLRFLPAGLAVAALCTVLSRGLALHPGYFYATYLDWHRDLDDDDEARAAALEIALTLVVGVAAFVVREPVAGWAAGDGGLVAIVIEGALIALSLGCLESAFVAMLPLRFLKGHGIARWNRGVWIALLGSAAFLVYALLLRPASGYIGQSTTTTFLAVIVAFVAFGAASFAFWAWFRFVPDPTTGPPGTESGDSLGPDDSLDPGDPLPA